MATVSEGALAAKCLVRLSLLESETAGKLDAFWKATLDADKQLFFNERFLLAASPQALGSVADIAERVALEQMAKDDELRPWLRAVCVAMICSATAVRRQAQAQVKRMVGGLGGHVLAAAIVEELNQHIRSPQVRIRKTLLKP